ncbi:MAG: hypothetical protein K2O24_07675 [Muribaculaceae bacterium]|nr:hypothetical protein [Muribaculaceae bacterium]
MRHPLPFYAIPAAALLLLPGCLDDKYDLSDVDTTTELKVSDLVVPVNLNTLTLHEVTDLSDNEYITTVKDAQGKEYYAFSSSESFRSGEIQIPSFKITPPQFPGLTLYLKKATTTQSVQHRAVSLQPASALADIKFTGTLPQGVLEIDHLGISTATLGIYLAPYNENINCGNLQLQFPAGLDVIETSAGQYNKTTGVLDLGETTLSRYSSNYIYIRFNGMGKECLKSAEGAVEFFGKVGILTTGSLSYDGNPDYYEPRLEISFSTETLYPQNITATVDYDIKNIIFDTIHLDGLPDLLASENTSINAAAPQIYIGINNNVGEFFGDTFLGYTSTFRRSDGQTMQTTGRTSEKIEVSKELRTNILLKGNPASVPSLEQYLNPAPDQYDFPSLSNVLFAGNGKGAWGLPKTIEISATDVKVKGTRVRDLPLGIYQPGFTGTYTVFVPLAFEKGSVVQYTSTDAGWDSEDLSDLRVNTLHVSATVSTDIPFKVDFSITPLDSNGRPIPVAESTHIILPANANLQDINLNITALPGQPITDLDGITYSATVSVEETGNNAPITPEMAVSLENVRITVDGAWTHKF